MQDWIETSYENENRAPRHAYVYLVMCQDLKDIHCLPVATYSLAIPGRGGQNEDSIEERDKNVPDRRLTVAKFSLSG
jgi:hypothetical protein